MTREEQAAFLASPLGRQAHQQTRRQFFGAATRGLGGVALASMLNPLGTGRAQAQAPPSPGDQAGPAMSPRQHVAKAKRVIFLYMAGGPSHLDLFDPKPRLQSMDGDAMPESFTQGQPIAQLQGQALKCMAPQFAFKQHGQSGQTISSVLPHTAGIADEICLVKSMVTEQINHDPAHTFMNTGTSIAGRPSMGSWVTYGLGNESSNLPGFVVLTSAGGGQGQPISARQWHSGFLPSRFQGVPLRSKGAPVDYVANPLGVGHECQRSVISSVGELNQLRNHVVDDPEIATRISQYEMAFRMQTSVPEMADLDGEPQSIKDLYGVEGLDGSFGANCLLARRLAERGVRFIQLYHRGWDHHGKVKEGVANASALVDQGSAALVKDLKQRGMLDDTLVIWGGEFGRTPMAQGSGRDHHIKGFSMWMAGGGVRPGMSYGATDDLGYHAVDNVVHVHDFHATMLHLLGIEHTQLTYRYQGRDFRLTDVFGNVLNDILT